MVEEETEKGGHPARYRIEKSLKAAGQACPVVADGPERSRGCQGAAMRRPGIRGVAEAYCYAGANPHKRQPKPPGRDQLRGLPAPLQGRYSV